VRFLGIYINVKIHIDFDEEAKILDKDDHERKMHVLIILYYFSFLDLLLEHFIVILFRLWLVYKI